MQVSEQVLKAFGIETCVGLIANRGLLSALFSPVSTNFFMGRWPGHWQACFLMFPSALRLLVISTFTWRHNSRH